MRIDRRSPVPLYYQLKDILIQQIESGVLKPGDQVPPENEIVETYGISRPTVRQALAALTSEGYLVRRQGVGTFVRDRRVSNGIFQKMTSFTTEMLEQGISFTTKVLKLEVQNPSSLVCEKLGLQPGDSTLFLERIRFIKGEPIYFSQTHLVYSFCKGLENEDLEHQSLYALLTEKYGCRLTRARMILKAVGADSYEAKILKVRKGTPLHFIEGLVLNADGVPVEYHWTRYRADKNQFCFEIHEDNNDNTLFYLIDRD